MGREDRAGRRWGGGKMGRGRSICIVLRTAASSSVIGSALDVTSCSILSSCRHTLVNKCRYMIYTLLGLLKQL